MFQNIVSSVKLIRTLFKETPLEHNAYLSAKHNARIYLKREDLTPVRSYKIRGAYNKMHSLTNKNPIVTCSAGNHAQGVAYSCEKLGINGNIFMPTVTTPQKIKKVKQFGKENVSVFLEGSTLRESFAASMDYARKGGLEFIHPFDDIKIIEGQGTVGYEIMSQLDNVEYILVPIGGGGLAAGVCTYIRTVAPHVKIIGVEPTGAASMYRALAENAVVELDNISTFVDGASVSKVGTLNFPICRDGLDSMVLIDEGHVCSKIIEIYNELGYIIEPAGVLSLCALDKLKYLDGQTVVALISGGNSDVYRMPEILERSLLYEGRKHYFRIEFPQKAGALKNFVLNVLGEADIIYFRYTKLIAKETGPVIIGVEIEDVSILLNTMKKHSILFEKVDSTSIY